MSYTAFVPFSFLIEIRHVIYKFCVCLKLFKILNLQYITTHISYLIRFWIIMFQEKKVCDIKKSKLFWYVRHAETYIYKIKTLCMLQLNCKDK